MKRPKPTTVGFSNGCEKEAGLSINQITNLYHEANATVIVEMGPE